MKKFILSSFLTVVCLCLLCSVSVFYAEFETYTEANTQNITPTEITETSNISKIKFQNNSLFVIDSGNKKIHKTGDSTITVYDNTDTPFDVTSAGNNYLMSTQQVFINLITSTETIEITEYIDKENSPAGLPYPQTFITSATGDIYLIQGTQILKFNQTTNTLSWFCELAHNTNPITYTNNGATISENGETIYFATNSQIFSLNTTTKIVTPLTLDFTPTAIFFIKVDNLENIYLLDNTTLYKINQGTTIATYTFSSAPTNLDIDFLTGTIYYSTNEQKIFKTTLLTATNVNFVTNYSQIAPKIALTDLRAQTSIFTAVATTKSTTLYSHETLLSPQINYEAEKTLLLLDSTSSDFYYIYDNNADNNQGFITGYILKNDCKTLNNTFTLEFSQTKTAKVITGFSKVFCAPISQAIANNTYIPALITLEYGNIVTIIAGPNLAPDHNGVTFVAIEYGDDTQTYIGYIDSSTLVSTDSASSNAKLVPNATTRSETTVYSDNTCLTESDTIDKNHQVKIISTLNGVSKIEYIVIDNEQEIIKTGFVKTSFLDDGSLTTTQIVGIILIAVSIIITIIISILAYRRRKQLLSQND